LGQIAEIPNVTADGTFHYRWALRGYGWMSMIFLNGSYEIHLTLGLKLSVKITVFLGYDTVYFSIYAPTFWRTFL